MIDLPKEHTFDGSGKLRKSTEAELTYEERAFCRRQARHIRTPYKLSKCMTDWAEENGHGKVDYDRTLMDRIIRSVGID